MYDSIDTHEVTDMDGNVVRINITAPDPDSPSCTYVNLDDQPCENAATGWATILIHQQMTFAPGISALELARCERHMFTAAHVATTRRPL